MEVTTDLDQSSGSGRRGAEADREEGRRAGGEDVI